MIAPPKCVTSLHHDRATSRARQGREAKENKRTKFVSLSLFFSSRRSLLGEGRVLISSGRTGRRQGTRARSSRRRRHGCEHDDTAGPADRHRVHDIAAGCLRQGSSATKGKLVRIPRGPQRHLSGAQRNRDSASQDEARMPHQGLQCVHRAGEAAHLRDTSANAAEDYLELLPRVLRTNVHCTSFAGTTCRFKKRRGAEAKPSCSRNSEDSTSASR